MNKLLIKLLPTAIHWIPIKLFLTNKNISTSYRRCLVVTEKHGNDLQILQCYIKPKNNYKKFDIFENTPDDYPDRRIDIKDILAIAQIQDYIC